MQELFGQVVGQKRQALLLAGVSSQQAFDEKQQRIAALHDKAHTLYFTSPGVIERKIELDFAKVRSRKGTVSARDRTIITTYWEMVHRDPAHIKELDRCHERAIESFVEYITKRMQKLFTFIGTATSLEPDWIPTTFQGAMDHVAQTIAAESTHLADYALLEAGLILPTMINHMIAGPLRQQVESAKKYQAMQKSFNATMIERHQRRIAEIREKIVEIDQQSDGSDLFTSMRATREYQLRSEQECIDRMLTEGSAIQAMEAMVPVLTEHDRKVMEAFTVETGQVFPMEQQALLPSVPHEMCLAEDELTVEHFVARLQDADKTLFKLFATSRVEEL